MILAFLSKQLNLDSRTKRILELLSKNHPIEVIELNSLISQHQNKLFGIIIFLLTPFSRCFKKKSTQWVYAAGLRGLPSAILCKFLMKSKVIYDSREIYFNDMNGISNYGTLHRKIEGILIPFADVIVSANQERLQLTKDLYNISTPSIATLNLVNSKSNPFSYQKKSNKNILYQGLAGNRRNLDKLIYATSLIPDAIFHLVTDNDSSLFLSKKFNYLIESNRLIIYPLMEFEELLKFINQMDLGIVTYSLEGLNNYLCSPNKLFEYIYAGIPVICTRQPFLKNIITDFNVGHIFSDEITEKSDIEQISNDIQFALEKNYSPNDFSHFNEKFSWSEQEKILKLFFYKHIV